MSEAWDAADISVNLKGGQLQLQCKVFMDVALYTGYTAVMLEQVCAPVKENCHSKGSRHSRQLCASNFLATVWGRPAIGCKEQVSTSFGLHSVLKK